MNNVGIIGFGRFGKILADLLSESFDIFIYDENESSDQYKNVTLNEITNCELIFLAVPIGNFETLLQSLKNIKLQNTTIIDVCSVKIYPVQLMEKYLPSNVDIIATHPMFGPDSYGPFRELKMVMYPVRDNFARYEVLKDVFESRSITVVEMTPQEHDEHAAFSQGITHFIGRVLNEAGVSSTKINTLGFNELLGVIEQTCNDSWDLFKDLQNYNPYTENMIKELEKSIQSVRNQIGDSE